jgi:glycosyltransferase involved in cell wall biosynthesis
MKIGLVPDHLLGWQGGRDFFSILFDSLSMGLEPEDEIRILSIAGPDTRPRRVARIVKHFTTQFPPDLDWAMKELTRPTRTHVVAEVVGRQVDVEILSTLPNRRGMQGNLPDVIGPWFGSKPCGVDVPFLGYIPDCQHLRLPQYFSPEEVMARNAIFTSVLQENSVLIVTSNDVRADLLRHFDGLSAEIISLPFSAAALPEWLAIESAPVCRKYRLPPRYFLCSNQFWQHKNHHIVLDALALARIEEHPISMVFTGAMEDYRAPDYVSNLMSRVQGLGVTEDCVFLGLIPKMEQIAIMKSAIAVVQPSLFEGGSGGGVVYDAVGLGAPVIVSDIPVNREIENYVNVFFPPCDATLLLRAMRTIEVAWNQRKSPAVLFAEGRERRRQCGRVLRSAFALAVARHRSVKSAALDVPAVLKLAL